MLAKTTAAAIIGIDAFSVEVEVNATGNGRDNIVSIVGLPDAAVRESRDRIHSAMSCCGYLPPQGLTLVNLAPADLKKEGASFDLAIALGILAASNQLTAQPLRKAAVLGELALDGSVRPVKGALPAALCLRDNKNIDSLLVPALNAEEAALAAGENISVYAINHLRDAVKLFERGDLSPHKASLHHFEMPNELREDMADVKGQAAAKRALEIAAAGNHNLLLVGPPGTGKSMLSKRVPGILPPMTLQETLEVSRIHSVLGLLATGEPLLNQRPFRDPHHTVSDAGLIGGGTNPTPGEISLSHNGVLFLDELPEFKRNVLEVLRQPMESGRVNIVRASGSCSFPANFMLIAAMNPCPCGMNDAKLGCRCRPDEIRRYRGKISGPLLDRIDMQVEVLRLSEDELSNAPNGESSSIVRERVITARKIQLERYKTLNIYCNADMHSKDIQKYCKLDAGGEGLLRQAINRFRLSPRAYDRILKVARTIADLAGCENIRQEHLLEAVNYRQLDRLQW